jgi:electron transfer flavoprotein alpha subunit
MKALVIAEHRNNHLKNSTLSEITFAKSVADSFDILLLSNDTSVLSSKLAKYGAQTVHTIEDDNFENYLAQSYATATAEVVNELDFDIVIAPATTTGKDFMPRVAAKLEAGMASDIIGTIEEDGALLFKRPIWAGSVIALAEIATEKKVVTVRVSAFDVATEDGATSEVKEFSASEDLESSAEFIELVENKSTRPELTDADIVVSGGRGLKSKEDFDEVMEGLADSLNAAIGASRAAVDAEYCSNDLQVGQTGKIVAPKLYMAVAISGAIQHLAGMKDSKTIVAINKDDEAPIFEVSDYGLVADAFVVVPELVKMIKDNQ